MFDYTPLNHSVAFNEVRRVKGFHTVYWLVFGAIAYILFAYFLYATGLQHGFSYWSWLVTGALLIGAAVVYNDLKRSVLLSGFAEFNGATYDRRLKYDNRDGVLFGYGYSKSFQDLISRIDGSLEIGNYRYVVGYGRSRRTYTKGFVRIKMPRQLPNMILDAKKNNAFGVSNLPAWIGDNQKLSLEGDFDKYFTLYAPKDYQIDALSIFTPDVMQELISLASNYDLEVIDGYIYIYSFFKFNFTKEQLMTLDNLVDKLGAEFAHQSSSYSDDRVGQRSADVIDARGVRLRRRVGISAGIGVVIAIIAIVAGVAVGLSGSL